MKIYIRLILLFFLLFSCCGSVFAKDPNPIIWKECLHQIDKKMPKLKKQVEIFLKMTKLQKHLKAMRDDLNNTMECVDSFEKYKKLHLYKAFKHFKVDFESTLVPNPYTEPYKLSMLDFGLLHMFLSTPPKLLDSKENVNLLCHSMEELLEVLKPLYTTNFDMFDEKHCAKFGHINSYVNIQNTENKLMFGCDAVYIPFYKPSCMKNTGVYAIRSLDKYPVRLLKIIQNMADFLYEEEIPYGDGHSYIKWKAYSDGISNIIATKASEGTLFDDIEGKKEKGKNPEGSPGGVDDGFGDLSLPEN